MEILANGVAVVDSVNDQISREVKERGLASDVSLLCHVLDLIKPGDWVIDGGAALGDHTGAYLERVGAGGGAGRVFAFEPNPEYFECLKHNCPTAIAIQRPLWNAPDDFFLHYGHMAIGSGYLSRSKEPTCPDDIVIGPIRAMVADEMNLEKLDYVKLDLEGAEYFALLGMEQTLRRFKPLLVLEMEEQHMNRHGIGHMHVYDLLERLGYEHKSIRNSPEPFCKSCDILCTPRA